MMNYSSNRIAIIGVVVFFLLSYTVYQQYNISEDTYYPEDISEVQMPSNEELISLREDLFASKTSWTIYVDSYDIHTQEIEPSKFDKLLTRDIIEDIYSGCAGECPYEFLYYMVWFNKNIDEMSDEDILAAYPIEARLENYSPPLTYGNIKDVSYYIYSKRLLNLMSAEEESLWFEQFIELPTPVTDEQRYYAIGFFSDAGDISGLKEKLTFGTIRTEAHADKVLDNLCGSNIPDEDKSGCNYVYSIKNNHFCGLDTLSLRKEANRFMNTDITCRDELKYMLYYANPEDWCL